MSHKVILLCAEESFFVTAKKAKHKKTAIKAVPHRDLYFPTAIPLRPSLLEKKGYFFQQIKQYWSRCWKMIMQKDICRQEKRIYSNHDANSMPHPPAFFTL